MTQLRNDSLIALKDGIVQWRGEYRHKEVSVVPWEYVRAKCRWRNSGNLAPQEYEPWMGDRNYETRKMQRAWLETDEGKEWTKKKEEKRAKQVEIQKKIRWDTCCASGKLRIVKSMEHRFSKIHDVWCIEFDLVRAHDARARAKKALRWKEGGKQKAQRVAKACNKPQVAAGDSDSESEK